jgi:hypothetical protein
MIPNQFMRVGVVSILAVILNGSCVFEDNSHHSQAHEPSSRGFVV